VTSDHATPRFIGGDCEEDCTRRECKASDQRLFHSNSLTRPDCSRANPIRLGSRFDKDATQLRAEPFDTGRTRSAVELDGTELPHYFRTTIAFAQQFAPPITATDAGVVPHGAVGDGL
jgi:hypothetical protein